MLQCSDERYEYAVLDGVCSMLQQFGTIHYIWFPLHAIGEHLCQLRQRRMIIIILCDIIIIMYTYSYTNIYLLSLRRGRGTRATMEIMERKVMWWKKKRRANIWYDKRCFENPFSIKNCLKSKVVYIFCMFAFWITPDFSSSKNCTWISFMPGAIWALVTNRMCTTKLSV